MFRLIINKDGFREINMTYVKPEVEVMEFEIDSFIYCSGDAAIGSFTCGSYPRGGSCDNITWTTTGYKCGSFSSGNCQNVTSPSGSTGDGCPAWKLTCSKF